MFGVVKSFVRRSSWKFSELLDQRRQVHQLPGLAQVSQIQLRLQYQQLIREQIPLPSWDDLEFSCFSQSGEDGLLWFLFSVIGTTNKQCVEICAGDGIECNTTNLLLNHGWVGLLFDGDLNNVRNGQHFFRSQKGTAAWPPTFVHAWITAENVNGLIRKHGVHGPVDLLSLDLDGVDYWVWEAIDCIDPRVVVTEFNSVAGASHSVTIPNDPQFDVRRANSGAWLYCGASLSALVKLGREKGYRLVGTTRNGVNAFFVKNGIGTDLLPEVTVASCFQHPRLLETSARLWPKVQDREWVTI